MSVERFMPFRTFGTEHENLSPSQREEVDNTKAVLTAAIDRSVILESKRPEYLEEWATKYSKAILPKTLGAAALAGVALESAYQGHDTSALVSGILSIGFAFVTVVTSNLSKNYREAAEYYWENPNEQRCVKTPHYLDQKHEAARK